MEKRVDGLVRNAKTIVIIQADNPDADSLGSALAVEHILGDMGKNIVLYCGTQIPDYLHYLEGWDRVMNTLPKQFDISVIVDASTHTLLDQLHRSGEINWLKARPCIVLDHHKIVKEKIDFTDVQIIDSGAASTGEIIFHLSSVLGWKISSSAACYIMASILGDTQGLTNELTTARTYRVMASLTELGGNRPILEEARRIASKMPRKIFKYKAELIQKTEFYSEGRIALAHITQPEIREYSPLFNPSALIQTDMLQTQDVALAIVLKSYDDGRVTAALRTNNGYPVAAMLAEKMGGGGHSYAAGFKITDGRSYEEIKTQCLSLAQDLLNNKQEEN